MWKSYFVVVLRQDLVILVNEFAAFELVLLGEALAIVALILLVG